MYPLRSTTTCWVICTRKSLERKRFCFSLQLHLPKWNCIRNSTLRGECPRLNFQKVALVLVYSWLILRFGSPTHFCYPWTWRLVLFFLASMIAHWQAIYPTLLLPLCLRCKWGAIYFIERAHGVRSCSIPRGTECHSTKHSLLSSTLSQSWLSWFFLPTGFCERWWDVCPSHWDHTAVPSLENGLWWCILRRPPPFFTCSLGTLWIALGPFGEV